MRKLLIVFGCCGLTLISVWASDQLELDAARWREYGKRDELALARSMYVKGYRDGYAGGDSAMEKITAVLTKDNPPDAAKKKLVAPQTVRLSEMLNLKNNVTVGRLQSAIDSFYGDYRNAPVCWKTALQFSVWSLNGDAPTEQELDSARKFDAGNGCH